MNDACLRNLCRRLRWLRDNPPEPAHIIYTDREKGLITNAYDYALRVVIDEMGATNRFHELFHGYPREGNG